MWQIVLEGVDPRLFNLYASVLAEILMLTTGYVLSEFYRLLLSIFLRQGHRIPLKSLGRMPADLLAALEIASQTRWAWPALVITLLFISDYASTIAFAGLDFVDVPTKGPNRTVLSLQIRNSKFPYDAAGDPINDRTISKLEAILRGPYRNEYGDEMPVTENEKRRLAAQESKVSSFLTAADSIARGESLFVSQSEAVKNDPSFLTLGGNKNNTKSPMFRELMGDATVLFADSPNEYLTAIDLEIPLECNKQLITIQEQRGVHGDFHTESKFPDCTFTSYRSSGLYASENLRAAEITAYAKFRDGTLQLYSKARPERSMFGANPFPDTTNVTDQSDPLYLLRNSLLQFPWVGGRLARQRSDFRQGRLVPGFGGVKFNDSIDIRFGKTMYAYGGSTPAGLRQGYSPRDTVLISEVVNDEVCGQDPSGAQDTTCIAITLLSCYINYGEGRDSHEGDYLVRSDLYRFGSDYCHTGVQQVELVWGRNFVLDQELLTAIAGTYGRNLKYAETLQRKQVLALNSIPAALFALSSVNERPSIEVTRSTTVDLVFVVFMSFPVALCLVAGMIAVLFNKKVIATPDDGWKMFVIAGAASGDDSTQSIPTLQEDDSLDGMDLDDLVERTRMSAYLQLSQSSQGQIRIVKDQRHAIEETNDELMFGGDMCGKYESCRVGLTNSSLANKHWRVVLSMLFSSVLALTAGLLIESRASDTAQNTQDSIKRSSNIDNNDKPHEPTSGFDHTGCFRDVIELSEAVAIWFDGSDEAVSKIERTYGPIDAWCVDFVEDFSYLFFARDLRGIDLSGWNTSSGKSFEYCFAESVNMENITDWTVDGATTLRGMFRNAGIPFLDVTSWNVSSVNDFSLMFFRTNSALSGNGDPYFRGTVQPDFRTWDVSSGRNFRFMFGYLGLGVDKEAQNNEEQILLSTWDMSSARDVRDVLLDNSFFNDDLSSFNVSSVVWFDRMFYNAKNLNTSLDSWDTSSGVSFSDMFNGAKSFSSDLSQWDMSKAKDLSGMFSEAEHFQSDLSEWDVSSVTKMDGLFRGASSFESDLSAWDVKEVKGMCSMFERAVLFNSDLSRWDVSNSECFESMFRGAATFDGDVGNWSLAKAVDLSGMFAFAISFAGSGLGDWQVGNVKRFVSMFEEAWSMDADLSNWDVSSGHSFYQMFHGASRFSSNLCGWNIPAGVSVDPFGVQNGNALEGTNCPYIEISDDYKCEFCGNTTAPSPEETLFPTFSPPTAHPTPLPTQFTSNMPTSDLVAEFPSQSPVSLQPSPLPTYVPSQPPTSSQFPSSSSAPSSEPPKQFVVGGSNTIPVPAFGTIGSQIITLEITGQEYDCEIGDVNVIIELEHSWASDLDARLCHPDGTCISLFSGVGGSTALRSPKSIYLDDEASSNIGSTIFDDNPVGTPQWDSLSKLNGKCFLGSWQLLLIDGTSGDAGFFHSLYFSVTCADYGASTGKRCCTCDEDEAVPSFVPSPSPTISLSPSTSKEPTGSPISNSVTSNAPSSSPVISSAACTDFADWIDSWGDGCQSYAGNEVFCANSIHWANSNGVSASDACCTCGGGNRP